VLPAAVPGSLLRSVVAAMVVKVRSAVDVVEAFCSSFVQSGRSLFVVWQAGSVAQR